MFLPTNLFIYASSHSPFFFDLIMFPVINCMLLHFRYQEVCFRDYDFDKDPSTPGTAHFSQIIWQATKLFGIGRAIIRRGDQTCTYFVARYDPPGNYIGQFDEQVKKGNFSKRVCKNLDKIIKEAVGNIEGENVELGTTVKPPTKENKNKTKLLSESIFKQLKGGECLMGSINGK